MAERALNREELRSTAVEILRDLADAIEIDKRDIREFDIDTRRSDPYAEKLTTITIREFLPNSDRTPLI